MAENTDKSKETATATPQAEKPVAKQQSNTYHQDRQNAPRNAREAARQMDDEKQFDERMVHIDRVARVVKGGRRFRFRALVVVGDHKGRVGAGVSKGADVTTAVTKATEVAKKQMIDISLYNGTLTHETEGKVAGARILLKPASPGTGLIAGGVVRIVLEVAGVHNALSKSLGSSNKINTAYATLEALQAMEPAKNWITKQDKSATKKPAVKTAKAKA